MEEQYRTKINELESACAKVVLLASTVGLMESKLAKPTPKMAASEDSRLKVTILEIENEHLKQQLALEKEKQGGSESLQEENQRLSAECRELNRRVFDLTMQASRNEPSMIQPNSFSSDLHLASEAHACSSCAALHG